MVLIIMKHTRGFTLIEWMVTITIGLFIIATLLSIFVSSRQGAKSSTDNGELIENSRLAIQLLSRDLNLVGFWGDLTGVSIDLNATAFLSSGSTVTSTEDCKNTSLGGSGSFPTSTTTLQPLWAVTASSAPSANIACIGLSDSESFDITTHSSDKNSDVIDLKFLNPKVDCSKDTDSTACASNLSENYFYAATTQQKIKWFKGSETPPSLSDMKNRQVWRYNHYLYFVHTYSNDSIPYLYQTTLGGVNGASFEGHTARQVPGIERIKIFLAIDTSSTQDYVVDQYLVPSSVTQAQWNEGRVLGAKIYVLARSTTADSSYTNNNTYQLGNGSFTAPNDHYRRMVSQATVYFPNSQALVSGS